MPRLLRLFCVLLLAFWSDYVAGQVSGNKNFVISRTYKTPSLAVSGDIKVASQQINYVDGLGRPLQNVSGQGSPSLDGGTPKDLAVHTEYDASGRLIKTYLPFPTGGSGSFKDNAATSANGYYVNGANVCVPIDGRGFSETQYEASPLNRVLKQYAGGTDKAIAFTYKVNNGGEAKNYTVSGTSLGQSGNYGDGQLTIVEKLDENGNKTQEFTDKSGRVVLRRAFSGSDAFDTYYVYNDLSLLCFVLQPQYQLDGNLDKYAFRYEYNERGLVYRKYVPGGGWTTLAYDDRDRLTQSTDALGKVIYYDYDGLNRLIETGELIGGQKNPLTKTWYDTYPGEGAAFVNVGDNYPSSARSDAKGLVTVTGSRVINPNGGYDGWLYTTMRYNDRYQVIQTIRDLFDLGGKETITRDLRFDGQVKREQVRQETAGGVHQVDKIFSFDHNDRLLGTQYIVKKNGAEKKNIDIAANRYDAIGQLKTKHLHSGPGANSYIEKLEYCYTPRGWLSTVTGQKSSGTNYGLELRYSNPAGGTAQFNGNIAEMYWRRNGSALAGYRFDYDGLSRLTNANGIENNKYSEKNISYDKNGNISALQRWNDNSMWDNLSYSYLGNQLKNVTDNGGTSDGFQKRSTQSYELYDYDSNGNATRDLSRNVDVNGLRYNVLNLIRQVAVANGTTLNYYYDGGGNKLRMDTGTPNTKYAGGFEYNQSNQLTRIAMEEGQIVVSGESYEFQYYLKDHLGNTRMVLNEVGNTLQETEYFPFGMPIQIGGTAGVNKYLFLNRETQPETGYFDLIRRSYDPAIGRFLAVDPVTETQESQSVYQYGWNNPILRSDPNGDCVPCLEYLKGIVNGVANGAKGTYNFLTENAWKKETWQATGNLAVGLASVGGLGSGGISTAMAVDAEFGTNGTGALAAVASQINASLDIAAGGTAAQRGELTGGVLWGVLEGVVASKGAGAISKLGVASDVVSLEASSIRFSQSSVNGVANLEASMLKNGWKGSPIDVVKMADGKLTTFDNTRVLAASRTTTRVKARIHDHNKPLPDGMAERFPDKKGNLPATYGQAVENRIRNQASKYRNSYPTGSQITGSAQ